MEFIIIAIIILILIIILKFVFEYSKKEIKNIAEDKRLDGLTIEYPENIEIAKEYLKMLNNDSVKIEENKDMESSLYIAMTNKIIIANVKKSYTRIQTIAHECLHSIQSKKLQKFNFIFSNIYLIYFVAICILAIFQLLPNKMLFFAILLVLGMVYNMVRMFLENDAMIKAKFLAQEYMQKKKINSEQEIKKIVNKYEEINEIGIKGTNYYFFIITMCQCLIYSIICIFR